MVSYSLVKRLFSSRRADRSGQRRSMNVILADEFSRAMCHTLRRGTDVLLIYIGHLEWLIGQYAAGDLPAGHMSVQNIRWRTRGWRISGGLPISSYMCHTSANAIYSISSGWP